MVMVKSLSICLINRLFLKLKCLYLDLSSNYIKIWKKYYYGFGPEENYIDRNKGALLGKYTYQVTDNLTPYLYPQECGNRTHVRELSVAGENTKLKIKGEDFEFSALHYTPYELENARHKDELPNVYQTVLCINEKQMGIAGDDTWGAKTHDEFLLDKEKHHLRFSFKGKL